MKKKIGNIPCCAKLLKDPNAKILLKNVAFKLGAGPLKILTVTLKCARVGNLLFGFSSQLLFFVNERGICS